MQIKSEFLRISLQNDKKSILRDKKPASDFLLPGEMAAYAIAGGSQYLRRET